MHYTNIPCVGLIVKAKQRKNLVEYRRKIQREFNSFFRKRYKMDNVWIDGKQTQNVMRWSTGKTVTPPDTINMTLSQVGQTAQCLQMIGNHWDRHDCETIQLSVCEKPQGKCLPFLFNDVN